MKKDLHWLRLYHRDFDRSTRLWPDEAVGAYLRLLMHQWDHGEIPSDPRLVAKIAKSARRHWPLLGPKFPNGVNPRMEEVRADQLAKIASKSERARTGAQARWKQCSSNAQASPKQCSSNAGQGQGQEEIKTPKPPSGSPPAPSGGSAVRVSKPRKSDPDPVYAAYPRKVGKAAACRVIAKLAAAIASDSETTLDSCVELLADRAAAYARIVKRDGIETRYVPHPATWFNRGSWDDPDVVAEAKRGVINARVTGAELAGGKPPIIAWNLTPLPGGPPGIGRVYARDGFTRERVLAEFAPGASRIDEIPLVGSAITIYPPPQPEPQ